MVGRVLLWEATTFARHGTFPPCVWVADTPAHGVDILQSQYSVLFWLVQLTRYARLKDVISVMRLAHNNFTEWLRKSKVYGFGFGRSQSHFIRSSSSCKKQLFNIWKQTLLQECTFVPLTGRTELRGLHCPCRFSYDGQPSCRWITEDRVSIVAKSVGNGISNHRRWSHGWDKETSSYKDK